MKYNKNELARLIALAEGQKKQVSIAQVKEILKCLCTLIKTDIKWLWVMLK